MKDFNVMIVFANGTYSHTANLKADSEKDAILKAVKDCLLFRNEDVITSVTVTRKSEINV